jgi:hypothetical protein
MNPIFYLHIPKTGGQTLATRLASAFDPLRVHYLKEDLRYPRDIDTLSKLLQSCDFIESHVAGPILADVSEMDVVTTIREPIARLVSDYRHIRREPTHRLFRASLTLTPGEFFRTFQDFFVNYQSRTLVHSFFEDHRITHVKNAYSDWLYAKLPEAVSRIKWLVPAESINDFTWLWTRETSLHIAHSDVNVNIAGSDDVAIAQVRQVIIDHPELYALDLELWNWSRRWMHKYSKRIRNLGIERRVASNMAFKQNDDGIWLTDGWFPPVMHNTGLVEWWAGPRHTSEVCFRRSGEQALYFDILVVVGLVYENIAAYSAEDYRKLDCRFTYENPLQPTVRIDLSGMGREGTILIHVPQVFSSIQFSKTDTNATRRSFSAGRWHFGNEGMAEVNPVTVTDVSLASSVRSEEVDAYE